MQVRLLLGAPDSLVSLYKDGQAWAGKYMDSQWYVYIVQARDDSLYTGITTDVPRRVREHNKGIGAKSLRGKRPVKLVFFEAVQDERTAKKREAEIKTWKRQQKLTFIHRTGLSGDSTAPTD